MAEQNWARNYTYSTENAHRPESLTQVQALVADSPHIKALGTRHSFNGIADSTANLLSTEKLNRVLEIDAARRTVTVEAGIKYGTLSERLHAEGFALESMASLPHISVAGACATATHGSGNRKGNLATAVSAMEIVMASGEVKNVSRAQDGETFNGLVVHLGGIGIVTKIMLDILPTYQMRQDVYENLPIETVEAHFDEISAGGDSVSLFTDWNAARFNQVWRKRETQANDVPEAEPEFFGAVRATRPHHPIPDVDAQHCTQQLGVPGPWHERLPHFRMDFTPSSGEELQSEYLLPRSFAGAALVALMAHRERIAPLIQISEVRTIAADNLWMSPCYGQDCVSLHFTWVDDWPAVRNFLPEIEAILSPFSARPHWGKLFTLPPAQIQALYPKLTEFRSLLQTFDPHGKFRNKFLEETIFGAE